MKEEIDSVQKYCLQLQKNICSSIEQFEPKKKFFFDKWQKPQKTKLRGSGCSAVLTDGQVIEQGGVNFSYVQGNELPESSSDIRPNIANNSFKALGVSVIMHPLNPYAPTSHCNVRLFYAINPQNQKTTWWFGGGFDLTPYYGFDEDCQLWHQAAYQACLPFGKQVYQKFKKWCDDYFYLPHRQEQRGIGGIFYDDLNEWNFQTCFKFMQAVGNAYYQTYAKILQRRHHIPYQKKQRQFQLLRRGRYVEFNLLYDRGTLFGIKSGGRIESILMSLPPKVNWQYDYQPKKNSPEEKLQSYLKPQDWINTK